MKSCRTLSAVNVSPCPVARNEPKWSRYTRIFKIWGQNTRIEKDGKCALQLKSVKGVKDLFVKPSRRCLLFVCLFCSKLHFLKCFWILPTILWLSWCHRYLSIKISVFIASQLIRPGMSVLLLRVATLSTPSKALKSYTSRCQSGKHDYFQPAFISPELVEGSICRRGRQYFQWTNWEGSRCFVRVRNSADVPCSAWASWMLQEQSTAWKPSSQTATGRSPPVPRLTSIYNKS